MVSDFGSSFCSALGVFGLDLERYYQLSVNVNGFFGPSMFGSGHGFCPIFFCVVSGFLPDLALLLCSHFCSLFLKFWCVLFFGFITGFGLRCLAFVCGSLIRYDF